MLKTGGAEPGEALSFVDADLMSEAGWPEAVAGCDYVLHVASPFPTGMPKYEDELIIPARKGALRVLRAAKDAGVKRVVMTSSFAAIGYGHKPTDQPFSEKDWTDPSVGNLSAYVKSKTLAELAAWDFIAREGGNLELSVVNPVGIFGPILGPDYSSSIRIVEQLMNGTMKRLPALSFGIVDVRDVADLHLRAMTHPAASGERFLASAGLMSLQEVAILIKERMGEPAQQVSTKGMSDWMVKLASLFNPVAASIVPDLGKVRESTSEKAKSVLGWEPRSKEEAIIATAESLVRLGLLHKSGKPR
jgi:nucleoside-diphosphate-sugar epimerase